MSMDPLAFNRASYWWNAPFTAEIDDVGVNPSRNLHIHTDINARKGIETTERNRVNRLGNVVLEGPYQ